MEFINTSKLFLHSRKPCDVQTGASKKTDTAKVHRPRGFSCQNKHESP
jgi:hypothetical protein